MVYGNQDLWMTSQKRTRKTYRLTQIEYKGEDDIWLRAEIKVMSV